jgi:hypothetical protein
MPTKSKYQEFFEKVKEAFEKDRIFGCLRRLLYCRANFSLIL